MNVHAPPLTAAAVCSRRHCTGRFRPRLAPVALSLAALLSTVAASLPATAAGRRPIAVAKPAAQKTAGPPAPTSVPVDARVAATAKGLPAKSASAAPAAAKPAVPAALPTGKTALAPGKPVPPGASPTGQPLPDLDRIPNFAEVTLDGIAFIKIPAGSFDMGTTDAQRDALNVAGAWNTAEADQQPSHSVTLTHAFLIGKYDVTQSQWTQTLIRNFRGKKKKPIKPADRVPFKPSAFQGADLPVDSVSWNDVQKFISLMNADGRVHYRLPTEAEWEYCCRAGSTGLYERGQGGVEMAAANLGDYAWYAANSGSTTHAAGSRKPNAWGLYDMAGNVWQWCQDAYSPTFYSAAPATDPIDQDPNASEHVLRGGCWYLGEEPLACTFRGGNLADFRSPYVGFRLVADIGNAGTK